MDVTSVSPTLVTAAAPQNDTGGSKTQTAVKPEDDQQPQSGGTPPAADADSARGSLLNTAT